VKGVKGKKAKQGRAEPGKARQRALYPAHANDPSPPKTRKALEKRPLNPTNSGPALCSPHP
jgi:hypothetical protein